MEAIGSDSSGLNSSHIQFIAVNDDMSGDNSDWKRLFGSQLIEHSIHLGVNEDMSGDNAVTNGSVDVKDSTGSLDMTQRFKTSLVVSQTTPSSESSLEF
ncbi:unnamed protein product, partial [Oppiella nova]